MKPGPVVRAPSSSVTSTAVKSEPGSTSQVSEIYLHVLLQVYQFRYISVHCLLNKQQKLKLLAV